MIDFSMFSPSRGQSQGISGDVSAPFLQPQLLTPIDPDAALRASEPVIGSTLADVIPDSQVRNTPNPFGDIVVNGRREQGARIAKEEAIGALDSGGLASVIMPPAAEMSQMAPRVKKDPGNPSGQDSGGIAGIIGRLLLGGSGDESSLDASTQKEKQSKRKSAGNASASFANDPEAAAAGFMQAPGTGGESFGSTLSKIAKMFAGL